MSDFNAQDDFNLQLVGKLVTATLYPSQANIARVEQAVADGRLLPTQHPTVFKVVRKVETDDDKLSVKGRRRRERVTPLVRPSNEGSGRWSVSDGPSVEHDYPAA